MCLPECDRDHISSKIDAGFTQTLGLTFVLHVAKYKADDDKQSLTSQIHSTWVTFHVVPTFPLTSNKSCVLVHGPHTKTELMF